MSVNFGSRETLLLPLTLHEQKIFMKNCQCMKFLLKSFFVALFALLTLQTFAATPSETAKPGTNSILHGKKSKHLAGGFAYFVDFNVETYSAVTPQTIEKYGDKISLNAVQMQTIENILHKTKGQAQFDTYRVRLSIKRYNDKGFILVSKPGTVWEAQGQRALTPAAVTELNQMLNKLLKQQNRKK